MVLRVTEEKEKEKEGPKGKKRRAGVFCSHPSIGGGHSVAMKRSKIACRMMKRESYPRPTPERGGPR